MYITSLTFSFAPIIFYNGLLLSLYITFKIWQPPRPTQQI